MAATLGRPEGRGEGLARAVWTGHGRRAPVQDRTPGPAPGNPPAGVLTGLTPVPILNERSVIRRPGGATPGPEIRTSAPA
ncbi:hypothetical protein GCM10007073_10690 [Micrococcus flavus]|nr:hypothetical protein GCM10007073_10690 [Micrococcus flavus]